MKQQKSKKLHLVNNPDARVYNTTMRTAVFADKRFSEKYKNNWKKGALYE